MIGSDEVITVPTTVLPSTVTSPTSDIQEQTTDEDSNDETTANVYGNDSNLIGIPDGFSLSDDMILDADQKGDLLNLDETKYRWTNGTIPYQISKQSFNDSVSLEIIIEVIEELNEELCIEIR